MYTYQRYLVLDWLWRNCEHLGAPTVRAIRKLAQEPGSPTFVRSYAIALLGRFGDYSDLERIASAYGKSSDPLERAQLLCSLERLELTKRNALLGRAKSQKPWLDRVVKLLKSANP
jgi:hypothetical protein